MLWRQLYSKFFRVFLLSGHTSNKKNLYTHQVETNKHIGFFFEIFTVKFIFKIPSMKERKEGKKYVEKMNH